MRPVLDRIEFMTSRRARQSRAYDAHHGMVARLWTAINRRGALNGLTSDLAGGETARDPSSREGAVGERGSRGDGHRGGHGEPFALALSRGLCLELLVDAIAVHNRAGEVHVATGPDAVRVHDASARVCGHRLVEGAGVLGLRPRIAHTTIVVS